MLSRIADLHFWAEIYPFILLASVGLGFVLYGVRLKRSLIQAYSLAAQHPCRLEDIIGPDHAELERLTREWEELGFVRCGDFVTSGSRAINFCRCLENASEGALVQITQQMLDAQKPIFCSSVTSIWGDEGVRRSVEKQGRDIEGAIPVEMPLSSPSSNENETFFFQLPVNELPLWTLTTHNRVANRFARLLCQPHLFATYLPTTIPERLWQTHRERCALIGPQSGLPLLKTDLFPLLGATGRVARVLIVRQLQATFVGKFILYRFAHGAMKMPAFDAELVPISQ